MPEDGEQYTIGELAERAGVTPRTVRFYVTEGLLPPPGGAGQIRIYTWEHALRLELIKRLKAQYLPLNEIRTRLDGLSVAELEALLSATPADPPKPSSALDYLAGILGGASTARSARLSRPPTPQSGEAPPPAPETTWPVEPSGPPAPAPAPPPPPAGVRPPPPTRPLQAPAEPRAVPADGTAPHGSPAAAGTTESAAPGGPPGGRSASSLWRRVLLAPGVELHYQPSPDAEREGRIARLMKEAARLLSRDA